MISLISSSHHVVVVRPQWYARLLCPWGSPGKNTGVDCQFLLQGIFPIQGSNPDFPHCRQILYHLSHHLHVECKKKKKNLFTKQKQTHKCRKQNYGYQREGKGGINWELRVNRYILSSVQFTRSVMSDSLQPHESQHARPPRPSPSPGVHSDSRPSSQGCHPAISSSVIPFSSCPQSLPASESFPMSQLFT